MPATSNTQPKGPQNIIDKNINNLQGEPTAPSRKSNKQHPLRQKNQTLQRRHRPFSGITSKRIIPITISTVS